MPICLDFRPETKLGWRCSSSAAVAASRKCARCWLTKTSGGETVLTAQGYAVAIVLMALFTVVNILGVRKLAQSNNVIMLWKVAIPGFAWSSPVVWGDKVFVTTAVSEKQSKPRSGGRGFGGLPGEFPGGADFDEQPPPRI